MGFSCRLAARNPQTQWPDREVGSSAVVSTPAPLLWALSVVVLLSAVNAAAQQLPFFVVVHPDNPTDMVSLELLADIYHQQTASWEDGVAIRPVDLEPGSAVREKFSEAILGRTTDEVIARRKGQSGQAPPPEVASEQEALDIVRQDRGAIAYVSTMAPLEGVKLVVPYRSPQVVERVPPAYPQNALRAGAQGIVVLQVLVVEDGTVGDVTVVKGLKFGLTQAAVRAVRQWRFSPATSGGIPISVEIEIAINFEL